MEEEEVLQQEQATQTDPKQEVKQQTPQDFSAKIKSKYPQYKDMDDVELAQKIVAKYPQYEGMVNFDVKKKVGSDSTSANPDLVSEAKDADGLLATSQNSKGKLVKDIDDGKYNDFISQKIEQRTPPQAQEKSNYSKELFRSLEKGSARLGESISATPEFLYDLFALPQNIVSNIDNYPAFLRPVGEALGVEKLAVNSEKLKDQVGIENKVKDFYSKRIVDLTKEQEALGRKYEGTITENFKKGNLIDGFRMLGNAITESLPISLSIMAGGAAVSTPKLLMGTTAVMGAGESEAYKKENPEMDDSERTIKSFGKGFAEGIFSTIGTGTIGVAAKEIIKKEGVEQGSIILKDNIVTMYKELLKKYPLPTAMLGEGLEEAATQMTQNAIDGKNIMEGVPDAFLVGMGSGGAFGGAIQGLKVATKDKSTKNLVETIDNNNLDTEKVKTELETQVKDGDLKPKEASEIYENFEEVREQLKAVPEDYSTEEKTKAVELLKQRSELEKKVEGKDPSLVENEKAKIEEINNELKSIKNPDAQKQENTQEETKSEVLPTENEKAQTEVTDTREGINEGKNEENIPVKVQNVNLKADENETTPTENTPTNEGVKPNIDTQEQGGQPTTSGTNVTYKSKGGYTVTKNKDNSISVVDKKGKEPSAPTRRKVLREYADTVDFTKGEKYKPQGDVSQSSGVDIDNEVATNSKNPAELAEIALRTSTKDFINDNVDTDAVAIIDYIAKKVKRGKIGSGNDGSFVNVSDANNITNSISRTYFSKKGEDGVGLDVLAQEISEELGKEFEPQDLVDYMTMYPNGISDIEKAVRDRYSNPAKQAFSEITGFPASDYYFKKAVEQAKKKEKLDNEAQNTYLDSLTEEELLNLHKEREQYEKTIEQGAEGVSETRDTTDSQEQSGVRERTDKTDGEQKTESISERVPQGNNREEVTGNIGIQSIRTRFKERSETSKGVQGESKGNGKKTIQKLHEQQDLEARESVDYAKENNIWYNKIEDLGTYIAEGSENTVVLDENTKRVYKSNNLANVKTISGLFDFVNIFNKIFPDTAYNFEGLTGIDSSPNRTPLAQPIFSQDFIENSIPASKEDIEKHMTSLGFNKKDERSFYKDGIEVSDLVPRNVIKDDKGNIYVIDALIKQIKPDKTDGNQEQGEVNLSESLKINDFIDNLDKAIDKLDQFGKETLGMNLPVAVAKKALQAMKLASLTAKTVADITSAGINAVKETNWYQNLSNKEQKDIGDNFLTYINKPFIKNNLDKTRTTIEEEVDEFISQGLSEKEALEQFENRREKMIAKDHLTRQKKASPEKAKKIVDGAYKNSEAEMNKKSNVNSISKAFRDFAQKIWDRQYLPKFLLMKSGGKLVRNYIVASKGANGYAKLIYEEAHDKIYKGLSSKEVAILDKIIMLRRFIAIDNNRAKENKPPVVHQDYINKDTAETYLSELENELGTEAYKDLNSRADSYFDTFRGLLDKMQESGVISKATRDTFFEIDYQPRAFLQFLKNAEGEISINEQGNKNSSKGLAGKQIQKLEDGLDTSLIWDSQYLISRAINVRTQSIAMNNANKKFADFMAEQKKVIDELKQKENPTKKEQKKIKYFEELSKNVRLNPIIGFNDNGDPKYMIGKTPNGFSNAYYYVNGVKHNLLMADEFYDQYYDNIKGIFKNSNVKEKAALASGTALVKGLATGNNPTFFLSNSPRDLMFIATFSDTYGWSVPRNILQLLKDTTKGVVDIKNTTDNFKNFVKYGGMMDFLHQQGRFKGTNAIRNLIDSKINNKTQERIGKAFKWATLQKMQMYSEIGFRMAVFNRSVKQQLKDLGVKSEQELNDKYDDAKSKLEDIYTNAVASARNTTDFNQGGTLIKDADAFIPYLNASTQGTKVMFDNLRERPIETTFRMAQSAAIISSIPISVSVALISAFRGSDEPEEDKDKSALELYLKARKGISKYERTNYMTVFTGKRDEEGEFEYYRIAKPHGLTPMISLAENLQQEIIKNHVGDESSNNMIEDIAFALDKNVSPLEFGITDNFARIPLLKAAMTYTTGYDFFREKDLSYKRGSVPVQSEGFENPSVEDFYKKIGDDANISPVRMKGAVESFITSPSTTPYVGVLYGGLDALMSDKDGSEVVNKLGKDLLKSTRNRVKKTTSDYNRRMDRNKKLQEKIDKVRTEDIKTKTEFRHTVKKYIDKEITKKELEQIILDTYEKSPFDAKRMVNKAKDMVKHKDVSPYVFEIKYSEPKVRAIMLADMFGSDLLNKDKGNLKLKKQLIKYKAINKETLYEYEKLIKD